MKKNLAILAFFWVLPALPTAHAATFLVTLRSGLSGSDSLAISAIGGDQTAVSNGFSVLTLGGNTVTFSNTAADGFTVLQQSNDWSGNFAANDLVLWDNGDAGPVTLGFSTAVGGIGLQIQPNGLPPQVTSFTASIQAFNSSHISLGSFSESGNSTDAANNSAIFLGIQSTAADIASIQINITSPAGIDFAFNELTFGAPAGLTVPEPSSWLLLLAGVGLSPALLRKLRRK